MNLNEQIIRPLLSNVSVIGLFFIPMITMRLFAEEKRSGTIELLATSPVRDLEIIVGKWLAALLLYACMLLFTALNFGFLFIYGHPDWKPLAIGYLGLLLQAGALLGHRDIHFHAHQEPDHRRRRDVSAFACCCGCWSGPADMKPNLGARARLHVDHHPLRFLCQRRARFQRRNLLSNRNFPGTVFHRTFHGILALEVIMASQWLKARQTKYAAYATIYISGRDCRGCRRQHARRPLQQVLRRHIQ